MASLGSPQYTRQHLTYLVTRRRENRRRACCMTTANGDSNWMGLLPKLRAYTGLLSGHWTATSARRTHMHRSRAGMLMQAWRRYSTRR